MSLTPVNGDHHLGANATHPLDPRDGTLAAFSSSWAAAHGVVAPCQHAIFQGHYFFHHLGMGREMRDPFKSHPAYERTAEFEPLLRRVLAQPRQSLYQAALTNSKTLSTAA